MEEIVADVGRGAGVMVRAIVLAAGKGTRMKSARPKVLHELCGRPMLWYVLDALRAAGIDQALVVTNDELDQGVRGAGVPTVVQREQLGTGHAVRVALEALDVQSDGRIVVAYGDMPLIGAEIFRNVLAGLDGGSATSLALITARMPLPSNFGRIVREGDEVVRIVEARDANPDELAIDEMNAGIYAFDEAALRDAVGQLRNDNVQGEYYLTDAVAYLRAGDRRVTPVAADDGRDVIGINDRVELALARKAMNARLCAHHMMAGVTIIDPGATYLEPELTIGRDTVVYPNTSIGRLSEIGEGCVIGPNARLANAKIGNGSEVRESVVIDSTAGANVCIGPFAHLRGETLLSDDVRVGNFVELKNAQMAARSKASHLTYLGDASVGEDSNIGAGTITANFDGAKKHRTSIGKNVRIGSNSSIVAPRTIGDGALTGAGAVVTKDVAPDERVAGNPARPLPKKP
ncbi:MAG TPA: bifunctional UDP-N-acetylglucosamine diphosphorylase/glucosamine-1-phosphate N-acetyltransferase GlmU [Candidatus Aquilonibacter sp.]